MNTVKRSVCICNGEYIDIAQCYTVIEGKQINIPEQVEKLRELAKQDKLLCACGCGITLTPIAGQAMLVRQHFREKPGNHNKNCIETEENATTINSKIILKCWLDDVFGLQNGDIRFRVPISTIFDTKRRFEYTHYVEKYQFGVCYERYSANILDEKLTTFLKCVPHRMLYFTDIYNSWENGQYPEYFMKIQNFQGFCLFLDSNEASEYFNAELAVAYFLKDRKELWRQLIVSDGKLSEYSLDENCHLLFNGDMVKNLLQDKLVQFEELQIQEAEEEERLRQEEERLKKEAEEAAIRRKEEKIRQEKERQLKAELLKQEREEREKERVDKYLQNHTSTEVLVKFLRTVEKIGGKFQSLQGNGITKSFTEHIAIKKIVYSIERNRIEIIGTDNVRTYLYPLEAKGQTIGTIAFSNSYAVFHAYLYSKDNIVDEFQKQFQCSVKGKTRTVMCGANFDCPHKAGNNECTLPDTQCSFGEIRWTPASAER